MADRLALALSRLGGTVRHLHIEAVAAGVFIQARIGDRSGACLVPNGYTAGWDDVARSLIAQVGPQTVGTAQET